MPPLRANFDGGFAPPPNLLLWQSGGDARIPVQVLCWKQKRFIGRDSCGLSNPESNTRYGTLPRRPEYRDRQDLEHRTSHQGDRSSAVSLAWRGASGKQGGLPGNGSSIGSQVQGISRQTPFTVPPHPPWLDAEALLHAEKHVKIASTETFHRFL